MWTRNLLSRIHGTLWYKLWIYRINAINFCIKLIFVLLLTFTFITLYIFIFMYYIIIIYIYIFPFIGQLYIYPTKIWKWIHGFFVICLPRFLPSNLKINIIEYMYIVYCIFMKIYNWLYLLCNIHKRAV